MVMTNANSPILRTSKTRDGATSFLHEDGTVSNLLATYGFTTLNADIMHAFFDNIEAVLAHDVPKAIKAANKGHLPHIPNEELMASESRAHCERARLQIEYDRRARSIMKCPHCGKTITGRMLAKALGSRTSELKKQTSAENGKLGGRPRIARLEEATAIAIRTIQRKSTDEQKSVRRARI